MVKNKVINLIAMLTYNDLTVENAFEVFDSCKNTDVIYWGIKEKGIPLSKMKELIAYMKKCGKTTVLEVVAYTENECLSGAKTAADCGCDILMGTVYFESVNDFCSQNNLKYMPFVGDITGRPSVLNGTIEGIVSEANCCAEKGVFGIDLLGYRYTGNASKLNEAVVSAVNLPVCLAGSVNSFERLDEVKKIAPWAFTVGSAFFENKFGETFCGQIETVLNYIAK